MSNNMKLDNRRSTVMGGVMLFSAVLFGCSGIASQAIAGAQEAVGAQAHHETAQSYCDQAEANYAEAATYERRAAVQSEYVDPKGFVKSGLLTAAQTYRAKARDLEQLAAASKQALTVACQ
ncbi:hypothetical protein [Nitrospira lenta]|uniref:Uncharacterized protein n=1 Tax=Nitrospira lenta TaxID=1436998 RepID=A0A330L395_9BACT|nr:hypothetical protein [Nitrospira lenta]SPP64242.1 exported hypothetical protein [Nitrospira lenta]